MLFGCRFTVKKQQLIDSTCVGSVCMLSSIFFLLFNSFIKTNFNSLDTTPSPVQQRGIITLD